MNAFKKALHGLKDTYPSPDPEREKAFLETLQRQEPPIRRSGRHSVFYVVPACAAAAVMLLAGIGIYQKITPHSLPMIGEETTTATVEDSLSALENSLSDVICSHADNTDLTENREESSQGEAISPEPSLPVSTAEEQGSGETETAAPPSEAQASSHAQSVSTDAPSTNPAAVIQTTGAERQTEPLETTQVAETPIEHDQAPAEDPLETNKSDTPQMDPTGTDDFEPMPNEPTMIAGVDRRVDPLYHYRVGTNVLSINDVIEEEMPGYQNEVVPDLSSLADQAELIVIADVEQTFYTQAALEPYTQLDLHVCSVLKGSCNENDKISVYEKGGYLPLDVAAASYPVLAQMQDAPDTIEFPGNGTRPGDRRCFFLKRSTDPAIPDGAFVYVVSDRVSCLRQKQSSFYSMDGSIITTISELWRLILLS